MRAPYLRVPGSEGPTRAVSTFQEVLIALHEVPEHPFADAAEAGTGRSSAHPDPGATRLSVRTDRQTQAQTSVALVRRLCDELATADVLYCHWKSNESLERSALAESDLDLLVSRRDAQRFQAIIKSLAFKEGRPPAKEQPPGVFHAYGSDPASGKVVHLHVHHRLILGDDTTKNYRLPIEDAYLASSEQGPVFRVPSAEFELVVFVLRMVLKHSTWDAQVTGKGTLSAGEKRELAYLSARADQGAAGSLVRQHLPFIGADLWEACRRCLEPGAPRAFRGRAALRLERSLAGQARRSPRADPFVRVWRRGRVAFRRHVLHRRAPRSRLEHGGALIAIVGGDGAGKSTAVEEIFRWLSRDLDVIRIHLGKPPRSLTSTLVHGFWRGGVRSLEPGRPGSGHPVAIPDGDRIRPRALVKLIRKVLTSRDRYLSYLRAQRFASSGGMVVTDRFPVAQVTLMDGPATAGMPRLRERSRAVRLLARLEDGYYRRISDPDVLIVLRVDPDVAVERRHGSEGADFVRRRADEVWRLDWSGTPAVVIDAGRPKDEVLAAVKEAIWARL